MASHPLFLFSQKPPVAPSTFPFLMVMIKVLKINSRTDPDLIYHIIVDTEKKSVNCDCQAGRIMGYCSHIKFYKSLIRRLMHENPG